MPLAIVRALFIPLLKAQNFPVRVNSIKLPCSQSLLYLPPIFRIKKIGMILPEEGFNFPATNEEFGKFFRKDIKGAYRIPGLG